MYYKKTNKKRIEEIKPIISVIITSVNELNSTIS